MLQKYFTTLLFPMLLLGNSHPLDIQSGMIEYSITGGGSLSKETNISIQGSATLYFDNWGDIRAEKEEGILLATGAIEHKQQIRRFQKSTPTSITKVDYFNQQLLEHNKNNSHLQIETQTKGLVQKGQDNILGYPCKIWRSHSIEKCIHRGIVLKKEAHIFGISYTKMAKEILFDINLSKEEYALPPFPKQDFGLLKKCINTDKDTKLEDFCMRMKEINSLENTMKRENNTSHSIEKRRQLFINDIAKDIFEKQKMLLPAFLMVLKETRFCLQSAKNPFEANLCLEDFSRFTQKLGTHEDDYIIVWNAKRKEVLLDKIEEDLVHLEARINCVNRANHFIDLSSCMK